MTDFSFDIEAPLFPLEGNADQFQLAASEHETAVLKNFSGKDDVPTTPVATILWGAPRSGKTFLAEQLFGRDDAFRRGVVPVCYDDPIGVRETSALFAIDAFALRFNALRLRSSRLAFADQATFRSQMRALFEHYRTDAQRVRSLVLNEAVARRQDVLIEATCVPPQDLVTVDKLRSCGYQIGVKGVFAPIEVSEEREVSGLRASGKDFYTKRLGAYQTLHGLLERAAVADLYWNAKKGERTVPFFEARNGSPEAFDPTVAFDAIKALRDEPFYLDRHRDADVRSLTLSVRDAIDGIVRSFIRAGCGNAPARPVGHVQDFVPQRDPS